MKRKKQLISNGKKGAMIRWDKTIPKATHGSKDNPLIIGDSILPCYVLEGGRRILIQSSIAGSIGGTDTGGNRIEMLLEAKVFSKYVTDELFHSLKNPIRFKTNKGVTAFGYDAKILTDICETILKARDGEEILTLKQQAIAKKCEILLRSFARVGLISLIDEVTGYQENRAKDALAKILEQYIGTELRPWVKTFSLDYFDELCRLKNLPFSRESGMVRLPGCVGSWTNQIIYNRIAPGLLKELKKLTPRSESGNKTAKYFQSLNQSAGYKALTDLLASVITLMKISKTYGEFEELLNKIHPICELNKEQKKLLEEKEINTEKLND